MALVTKSGMDDPFILPEGSVELFRKNAFIKLKNVFSAEALTHYAEVISEQVLALHTQHAPLEERDTYGKAFLQVMNLWTNNDLVRQFVFGRRLAKIAADLLEVDGVRLYHDQALYKEAGGGYTPWHADQYYWPLATEKCVTAWIPLQETPLEMGALEFSAGSHLLDIGRDLPISDESEAVIDRALDASGCEHVVEPFALGEVSFHAGWLFHRASPNVTERPRRVMTVIYMDRDMRLKKPSNVHQQADWDAWCPGAKIGEVIDSPLNPVLF